MLASDEPEYLDIFLILHAAQGIIYLLFAASKPWWCRGDSIPFLVDVKEMDRGRCMQELRYL
jgi:hypothetical protein